MRLRDENEEQKRAHGAAARCGDAAHHRDRKARLSGS